MSIDLFCDNYNNWLEDGKIVSENEGAYSILSVTPACLGHSIIIPKQHAEKFNELSDYFLISMFRCAEKTFDEIRNRIHNNYENFIHFYKILIDSPPIGNSRRLGFEILENSKILEYPKGYNLGINVGQDAGQSVNHIHMHLFPRYIKGTGISDAMRNHISRDYRNISYYQESKFFR